MATALSTTTGGWKAVLGCTPQALALYRIVLGTLLCTELVLRFRFLHPFYSDQGTLPLRFLWPRVDEIYHAVCLHCWSGAMWYQQLLLSIQVVCAACFTLGHHTRLMAVLSWFLYLSLTLRNTWLNFILDRYFHYLLWYSMFLPLDTCWSLTSRSTFNKNNNTLVVSLATIALKLQVVWIYIDAGCGKLLDPLGGWTWSAEIPALDTYARHTLGARYVYALLQPIGGLRVLTPIVVYEELLSIPLALIGSYFGLTGLVNFSIALICSLHIGIAITLRNTVLLSLVACCACVVFLSLGGYDAVTIKSETSSRTSRLFTILSFLLMLAMIGGSVWLEVFSQECDQSVKHIWSTLLHNRWNVFVGAEEYVTWEIAPGRLRDGNVVDVWGFTETVDWRLPGTGAPCTSTARPGRWRSFPYLAGISGDEGDVLWGYLCDEWNAVQDITENPGRELVEYNFFMLQADILPDMGFSATRKRLIHSHKCLDAEVYIGVDGEPRILVSHHDNQHDSDDIDEL